MAISNKIDKTEFSQYNEISKPKSVISLSNVCLNFKSPENKPLSILHDVNMQVNSGEMVSITGASGSGKTSLLMIIAGVEKASGGQIIVMDEDITNYNEDNLAKFRGKNIGVVFQNFHLIPTMNALENVEIALELSGHKNSKNHAKEALVNVGLEKRINHYPDQLSGGEQQRVALARAFATNPSILLADEPTGNLDSENGHNIIELMMGLKKQHGTSLVLITHDMNLAKLASRQFIMQDGRLNEKT